MLSFCNAVSVASASDIIDDVEWLVNDLETVDLQAVYNQLLVVNDTLSQILAFVCVIFAFILFVFVFRFVYNIFFKYI